MPNLFNKQLDLSLIIPLMESHQVQKAYLFGSMGTDQFNPKKSDFDILVEIDESNPLTKGELLISLWDKLENLTRLKVDLLTLDHIKNPIFKKSLDETKRLIYDRSGEKVLG